MYQDEGPNLVAFVKAYYEWLEQNHQLITLQDSTNFNIGDTVTQNTVTGTIIGKLEEEFIVLVDGLNTLNCLTVCSSISPITSSSGGDTFILAGGRTKRLGALFFARNLPALRDIDSTIDNFVLSFKEKYLKNIEFDTATNKRLLVKNSLDLYRSKGTERSIDLFFKLVYGVDSSVYYPGEDIFRLSDGEWIRPRYLEINGTPRAIDLVGKQITGVTSGATAFVEKYIKRRIKDSYVHILYVSATSGAFINSELLISDIIHPDTPKLLGSLNRVEIITRSNDFSIGDTVQFNGTSGDEGLARVEGVSNVTGLVDFIFVDGGWGYTESNDPAYTPSELAKRTQSIVSEKVLTLANVVTSNTLASITVTAGGSGYTSNDVITVSNEFATATARPITNATGGIIAVTILNNVAGFKANTATVVISNTIGTSATLVATTQAQSTYFRYFESFNQPRKTTSYTDAANSSLFTIGLPVHFGNSTVTDAYGVILSNDIVSSSNGTLSVSVSNGTISATNKVFVTSNTSITANLISVVNDDANSSVMGQPIECGLSLGSISGTIDRLDEVYQVVNNREVANGIVSSSAIAGAVGSISVTDISGVFTPTTPLLFRDKATTANITDISLTVGVYNVTGTMSNTANGYAITNTSYTTANVVAVSRGTGASFKVRTIGDTETIFINSDLLGANNIGYTAANSTPVANQSFMSLPINNFGYGFQKSPQGNSASIIFSCLNFDSFEIGSIGSLGSINPGTDYNADPYVLAYQPYISGFNKKDYVITVSSVSSDFLSGEFIEQSNTTQQYYSLVVTDETGYQLGEQVYQGTNATSAVIHSITPSTNTIIIKEVTGTFAANSTPLSSYITPALSALITSSTLQQVTSTARAIVKSQSNTTVINAKRVNFNTLFTVGATITGKSSGSTATIVSVEEEPDSLPIGLNANISANVITATGSITSLQVIDSGIGYSNGNIVQYTSEDGLRAGEAKLIIDGLGTGSGYFKSTKGFISSDKYIHDGDYYSEYSYEVITRIPLDKYADMFKKVMHTAGTKFFGSVLIQTNESAIADVVESSITQANTG
jgi:hypothetical protein